ncbi:MAG: PQQ-binding-like beta-propeller repeat protein [Gordonia sp. (in: high G+C Gram-positive bacteria)]|uniref:PQQ-binding-like beta-propeller repeat protein n=1 Tax=Gordonia sp. (in: high G+C Gram-positive bacteria) TaxID=84139 RepID=UPI0039E44AAB
MSLRLPVLSVALAAVLVTGLAGCGTSDKDNGPDVPTVTPQTPLSAPPLTAGPEGTVVPAAGVGRALAIGHDRLAAVARDGKSIALYSASDLARAPQVVVVPEVGAIAADRTGFVAVGRESVVRVGLDGAVASAPLDGPGVSVATDDREVFVGTGDGRLLALDETLKRTAEAGGFVAVDAVAVARHDGKRQIAVLDKAQSLITTVEPDTGGRGAALRAGNGATALAADHYGRLVVANPRDGQLLGFYGDPLIMKFRFPIPDGPQGLAYDDRANLLWVTETAANQVVAYDLSSGEPRERARFASVRQPDSVVVDPTSGAVVVLSATGDGLQRVAR